MSVHITKTYNIGGLIGLRQNAVKNAGETLGFKEMSLFKFPDAYDSDDELHVRMDGIIASLCPEDIVIFQHPSGESPRYDGFLFEHLRRYHGTKIVAFIQEIASDRDDSEYALSDEITLLNRADMFIFASAALRDYYIANGLKEKPYLIQNIPDYMTDICANEHKNNKLYIMAENECGHGCYNDGRKRNRYKARRRSEGAWRLSCHRYRQDEQFKIREAGEGSRR